MNKFADLLVELTQIDNGAFIDTQIDTDGNEQFVEIKFVVKGETFDFEDAILAFEDKKKRNVEKIELKAKKLAELQKKKEEAEAKKKAKENK